MEAERHETARHVDLPMTDLSERNVRLPEQIQRILRETEDKYRSFFESIEQGYYEVDLYGNFTFLNNFVSEMLGYSKDALLGTNYRKYTEKGAVAKVFLAFHEVYSLENPKIGIVIEIIRKDGVKRQIGLSVGLMKDSRGRRTGFRGIARDITERRIMEGQLQQAQMLESIGQLAAGISHEINTPIQYVSDNTRFLLDSFKGIEMVLEKYEKMYRAVKADSMKQDILREVEEAMEEADFEYLRSEIPLAIEQTLEGLERVSKIVMAMKEFSHPGDEGKTLVDINKAIQSTIVVSKNEWKYTVDLETAFDPGLPPVPCFVSEFNQVILNLIINAAQAIGETVGDASHKRGKIIISTRKDGDWAEILICDNGPGIPEGIRSKVYDPFFTTKEVGKGTGQGLSLAHSVIVKKHRGTIRFETDKNKGTTFIIRLPIRADGLRKV
ncbi:MAG: ATP-binding protein [Pseudomonadota bacterium]